MEVFVQSKPSWDLYDDQDDVRRLYFHSWTSSAPHSPIIHHPSIPPPPFSMLFILLPHGPFFFPEWMNPGRIPLVLRLDLIQENI